MSQLDLFGAPDEAPSAEPSVDALAAVYAEAADLAARIDPRIRFGTSSWSFPGWRGLVYSRAMSESALSREGLREYAQHPLLRTVGIDRSFYAPIPDEDLQRYAGQLPGGFLTCAKAGASVTSAVGLGGRGQEPAANPDFLSPAIFIDEMLTPFARHFRQFSGPFVLEFPPLPRGVTLSAAEFLEGLDNILGALPRDFHYAVELRERDWLTAEYAQVLRSHGASHVFNYWSRMPLPAVQADIIAPESQPLNVIRLLLPPGTRYQQQREAFRPFDKVQAPDPVMRSQVVALARRSAAAGRDVFILVNNKAEGSSPLTVMEIARLLTAQTDVWQG
ncbi:MAG: DUF72 domain-containing protein [Vicinamibacteria bacterium]|nr:DUF72 domain-containing protein [Vicinamibacteria bacterium]